MTAGLNATHANALLNIYRGTTVTGITLYIKLHKGDPGASATANASAVTTRNSATFAAASGGAMSLSAAPTSWSMTATEDISYISCWDASSGGNFIRSIQLASVKSVQSGDTFTLSQLDLSYTPLAA